MPTNSVTAGELAGVADQLLDERGRLAEHLADRDHVARPDVPGDVVSAHRHLDQQARLTLPVGVIGSSSMNWTTRGFL